MSGRLYFVGAGPGDPRLITSRGLDLLRSCDVVVLDRLIPPALLAELKPGARRIYAGQRPGEPPPDPAAIRAAIVEHVQNGDAVVHLDAGDPLFFSDAAPDVLDLARAGVPVEIVPGVPPALAAPAYAGIPLTARAAGAVSITSARPAGASTAVLLADETTLRAGVTSLLESGRDATEPVAVIEWGTTTAQRVVEATLGDAAERAAAGGLRGPLVLVAGEVVAHRRHLAWFERKPLFGLRVVVTRGRGQAGALTAALEAEGAAVVEMPVITIADPESWDELDQSLRLLAEGFFKWVVFTSANAVDKVFERLDHAGLDSRAFGRVKVAAVGSTTAGLLAGRGIRADLVPPEFTGAAVAESLGRGSGRVLLPRVEGAPPDLVDALSGAGWNVREVVAYRNLPASGDSLGAAVVASGRFDVVTFTSASTVRNFIAIAGSPPEAGHVACIGPVTAEAARAAGLRADVVAEEHTVPGLVRALLERFGRSAT
ncbi:MAG TPA: uroporphyrinogen-III synthase [Actinomycetota bacterium]|nr:uroporphyrinogen-III synthase [Actinomycetota bacterium]